MTEDGPSEGTLINGELPEKKRSRRLVRENWYRDVWLLIITALVVVALLRFESTQNDLADVVDSNVKLTNQVCVLLVNVHNASLVRLQNQQRQVAQTRNYIRNIPPEEAHTQLNEAIRRNVPQNQADLKAAKQSEKATRVPPECVKRKVKKPKDK